MDAEIILVMPMQVVLLLIAPLSALVSLDSQEMDSFVKVINSLHTYFRIYVMLNVSRVFVILMPCVLIQMVPMLVHAIVGFQEMETLVKV